MTFADRTMRLVKEELGAYRDARASIEVIPPDETFLTERIVVTPRSPGAARIIIWEEDGLLVVSAGKAAQFEFDGENEQEEARRAFVVIEAIVEGKLVERFWGRLALRPSLEEEPSGKWPGERRLRWRAYG